MKTIKSVSLIGLGAIGAAYGGKLHDILKGDFKVVVNEERIHQYQKSEIKINDQVYHFHYITPETKTEPADLVIFAVKNDDLPQAIRDMQYQIGPDTIILSLLNGISSEEVIYNACQNKHILYSMSVEIDALRVDRNIIYTTIGRICYGSKDDSSLEDILAIKDLFDRVAIPYEISDNIARTMWWKFMINVGINQTSAVLKAPYGVFQKIPLAYEWMEAAMYEVVALSEKAGIGLTKQDVKKFWPILNRLSPEGKTSMLQDIEAGRKTEVDYFAGQVCKLGKKYEVPTPVNDQLYKMIHIIEEMANL
jgi:2-dehydropantoate 2-reductase